jgi:hypothetical protein
MPTRDRPNRNRAIKLLEGMRRGAPAASPPEGVALLIRIDEKLRRAKSVYDQARRPEDRRLALGFMITALMDLVDSIESWRNDDLSAPLRELLTAFLSLEHGAIEPLLRSQRKGGRPPLVRDRLIRGHAAAASEMLLRAGWKESAADRWVAERLSRDGYIKGPSEREDIALITATTICGWRKEARERPTDDALRAMYELWLDAPYSDDAEKAAGRIIEHLRRRFPPIK